MNNKFNTDNLVENDHDEMNVGGVIANLIPDVCHSKVDRILADLNIFLVPGTNCHISSLSDLFALAGVPGPEQADLEKAHETILSLQDSLTKTQQRIGGAFTLANWLLDDDEDESDDLERAEEEEYLSDFE